VGVTAGSREVPGRKSVTRDNNNDDDDNNNNNNNNNYSFWTVKEMKYYEQSYTYKHIYVLHSLESSGCSATRALRLQGLLLPQSGLWQP
jgi:hypothetical protein